MQATETIDQDTGEILPVLPTVQHALATQAMHTPVHLLDMAVQRGASLDQLDRLMAMKERWDAAEAVKAFNVAFVAFKAEAIKLPRTKKIANGPLKGKSHVELSGVVEAATPALSRHGLSAAWKLTKDEPAWMEVTCTLSHVAGHSEAVSMGGAPDTGPGRNAIQARGSVKTYLERYTLTAILGLAASGADDDGAGGAQDAAGAPEDAALLKRLVTEGKQTKTDEGALAFWNAHKSSFDGKPGAYKEFKNQMAAHRVLLKEANK